MFRTSVTGEDSGLYQVESTSGVRKEEVSLWSRILGRVFDTEEKLQSLDQVNGTQGRVQTGRGTIDVIVHKRTSPQIDLHGELTPGGESKNIGTISKMGVTQVKCVVPTTQGVYITPLPVSLVYIFPYTNVYLQDTNTHTNRRQYENSHPPPDYLQIADREETRSFGTTDYRYHIYEDW